MNNRPSLTPDPPHRPAQPPDPVVRSAGMPARTHRRGRWARLGVWAALACGPCALFASCAAARVQPVRVRTAPAVHVSTPVQDPAGFAQLVVGLWLRAAGADASGAQARALYGVAPVLAPPAGPGGVRVDEVATVRSVPVRAGWWAVTVAAEFSPAVASPGGSPGTAAPVQVRYFQLPVEATGAGSGSLGTLAAAGAPAEVGAPRVDGGGTPAYTASVAAGSPLVRSVAAFAISKLT